MAAPLRSEPLDAAVAEVLGILSVRMTMTRSDSNGTPTSQPRFAAFWCVTLGPFRCRPWFTWHAAVLVDQDQGSSLIEEGRGRGDSKLDGRNRQPALVVRMRGVAR